MSESLPHIGEITTYRVFRFIRSWTDPGVVCYVKYKADDDWINLLAGSKGVHLHFLSKLPDLKGTTAEFQVCAPHNDNIKGLIHSK